MQSVQSRISYVLSLDKFEAKPKPKPEVIDLEEWFPGKPVIDLGSSRNPIDSETAEPRKPVSSMRDRDFPFDWMPVASGSGTRKRRRDDDCQTGPRKLLRITPTRVEDAQSKHLLSPSSSPPTSKPQKSQPIDLDARAPSMPISTSKPAKPYTGNNPLPAPIQTTGFEASEPYQDPITPTPRPRAS